MTETPVSPTRPDEPAAAPRRSSDSQSVDAPRWEGPTYYGRPQLKPAPFNVWAVGGYVFLAGLSGSSAILATAADLGGRRDSAAITRRGRFLSLLAPTLGSVLLVWDLHTPQRFYNMLRIAKGTSPMSIGTWILMSFTGFAGLTALAQVADDAAPQWRWPRLLARGAQIPAALTGAGLSTYTAGLLSATSTPLWAAAPRALAARFGSSSVASGASVPAMTERSPVLRRRLDALASLALVVELAGTLASHREFRRVGVGDALDGRWGRVERYGATLFGMVLPITLHAAATLTNRDRGGRAVKLARIAGALGSMVMRVSTMGAGNISAERPDISMRFAQPQNLPDRARSQRVRRRRRDLSAAKI